MLRLRSKFRFPIHENCVMHRLMTHEKHIEALSRLGYEPSVHELLADPMVKALMARDGVEERAVNVQLERLARAVAAAKLLKARAH